MPPRTRTDDPTSRAAIRLRPPTARDGAALCALAREVGLDRNSPYAYVMWGDYFPQASVVAEWATADRPGTGNAAGAVAAAAGAGEAAGAAADDGTGEDAGTVVDDGAGAVVDGAPGGVVGFVTGFLVPAAPDTLFVWQVGVRAAARGRGVAAAMLDELLARTGARWMEATVTPGNTASAALFTGTASRYHTGVSVAIAYPGDMFPGDHEAEARFRLGPFGDTTEPEPD